MCGHIEFLNSFKKKQLLNIKPSSPRVRTPDTVSCFLIIYHLYVIIIQSIIRFSYMFDMRFRYSCFQKLAAGIGFSVCRDRCVG